MGEPERRAFFFLLDMMIGDFGGDKGSREGVARIDLEGLLELNAGLEGLLELNIGLEGVFRLPLGLEGETRQMVDLEGVPSSLRGVPKRLPFGWQGELRPLPGVAWFNLEGVPRLCLDGVKPPGEPPSSKRLILDGVPRLSTFSAFSCDVATLAGVLLGVFRIGLFSFQN